MFQEGQRKILINKNDREIRMDRTAILDYVKQFIDQQIMLLPANAEFLENGEYYSHLKASTRILEANDEKPEKSRFVWAHSKPDHYFLAEAYCVQAWMLVPNVDLFDFFKEQAAGTNLVPELSKVQGMSDEEKQEMERIARMDPQRFLRQLRSGYTRKGK
jgi:hypothetical protein